MLNNLGGIYVTPNSPQDEHKSYQDIKHFIMLKENRRSKFITALSLGKDIVDQKWLIHSHESNKFLPTSDYILSHPESEKEFNFTTKESVQRVKAFKNWVAVAFIKSRFT